MRGWAVVAAVVLVTAAAGVSRAEPGVGERYVDAGRPFSVRVPAGYHRIASPAANILVQWVDAVRGLSLAVAWSAMDTSAWKSSSRLTMRLAVEAGMRVTTKGFTRITSRTFDYRDLPAMEIEYEFLGEDGQPLRTIMRYYFTGNGQYMALIMGPPAAFEAARGELVSALDSFELKAPWHGPVTVGGVGAQQLGMVVGLVIMGALALVVFFIARSSGRRAPARGPYLGPPPYGPPPGAYPPPPGGYPPPPGYPPPGPEPPRR
jgi:hypothetical protein